jgi:uncharacterized OB-fold protein
MRISKSGMLHASSGSLQPGNQVFLKASFCGTCDRHEFPARAYCPTCDAHPVEVALSGRATIAGFSAVLHQPPGGMIETPYAIALAEFPEGVAILGTVQGADYRDLAIGDVVETVAREIGNSVEYTYRLVSGH